MFEMLAREESIADLRQFKPSGHVGFDSIPDQLVNKATKKGYEFNIMCVGETGLGKSTLMETLFNARLDNTPSLHHEAIVKLAIHNYELQENNVRLKLSICDTVGYGDQINKTHSFKSLIDYIDAQFENYLQEELKLTNRNLMQFADPRIHACLYFICPTGRSLKPLDIICMKQLENKVNIIPIIAKADALTKDDLQLFKMSIMKEIEKAQIHVYQFPIDDDEFSELNKTMNQHYPFAIVGSSELINLNNKSTRVRQYPWGIVLVENENHCDFVKLREMLIRNNMEDLREQTHYKHYESYRQQRLLELGFGEADIDCQPGSYKQIVQIKHANQLADMQSIENNVREKFVQRVKETDAELNEYERILQERSYQLKKEANVEKKQIEEAFQHYEQECIEFNNYKAQFMDTLHTYKKNKKSH